MNAPEPRPRICPGESEAPRLVVRGLTKTFGDRVAISDVAFCVHPGEFVAVLGASGAGKTTLFRAITGLALPDTGEIRLAGTADGVAQGRERRAVGVVFQQFNLVSRLSALDNVLAGRLGYVPAWRGWTRHFERADRLLALECLDRVGLLDFAGQRADTLSGGQQQRVAIARALAQHPGLIVADEPVASLDPQISAGILELLRGICHVDGVAVLCSLHQVHLARAYADRLIGLAGGCVVVDRPVHEVSDSDLERLYRSPDIREEKVNGI